MRRLRSLTRRAHPANRFGARTFAAVLASAAIVSAVEAQTSVFPPTIRDDLTPADRLRVEAITAPTADFSKAEAFELLPGGAATSKKRPNHDAFSQFSANLTFAQEADFKLGNALFRKLWVSAPSSTQASDGLGPLFNARACQSCHLKDGRGHPPEGSPDATSMFLRLARAAETAEEEAAIADHRVLNYPDPVYGKQLQDLAVPGLAGEGRMQITYTAVPVQLSDATAVLRKPVYDVTDLAQGPLDPGVTLSPRVTPQMIGLGLIEEIHPADIFAHADPDDRDGDGVSGRASVVREPKTGLPALGRFGWKASTASVRQQSAEAFNSDIGISTPESPKHWGECTPSQTACLKMPDGVQERLGAVEAPPPVLDLVAFYAQNLAVPARRKPGDAMVLAGKALFYGSGCASCHTPKFVTRRDAPDKAQSFQLIWPYSDFLLHDMGEGLADGQQVGDASGQEWRTPPLWGIGLTKTVNGHTFFLHDGRARDLSEAILWHGGEAQKSRDAFAAMRLDDRAALLEFLGSL